MTFHREPSVDELAIFFSYIQGFANWLNSSEGYLFSFFNRIPHIVSHLFSPWDLATNTYLLKRFPERVESLSTSVFPVPSFLFSRVSRRCILLELSDHSDSDGDLLSAHQSLTRRSSKVDSSANFMRHAFR